MTDQEIKREAYDLVIELSVPGQRFGPVLLYTVIVFCIYTYFNENTMSTWQVRAEEEGGALHGHPESQRKPEISTYLQKDS